MERKGRQEGFSQGLVGPIGWGDRDVIVVE
jgi:hypothetical protein